MLLFAGLCRHCWKLRFVQRGAKKSASQRLSLTRAMQCSCSTWVEILLSGFGKWTWFVVSPLDGLVDISRVHCPTYANSQALTLTFNHPCSNYAPRYKVHVRMSLDQGPFSKEHVCRISDADENGPDLETRPCVRCDAIFERSSEGERGTRSRSEITRNHEVWVMLWQSFKLEILMLASLTLWRPLPALFLLLCYVGVCGSILPKP